MLPPEFKILIKDTLRGARFAVRHSLRSSIVPEVLTRTKITEFADSVMTTLESGVVENLQSAGLVTSSVSGALNDLKTLPDCRNRDAFERRFQADYYLLTKAILKKCGVENAYIAEHNFGSAARTLARDVQASAAEFFARAAVAILTAQPVRFVDKTTLSSEEPAFAAPNSFAACCIGLAATVYAVKPDSRAEDCFESAVEVVKVAHPKFVSALQSESPVEALTQLNLDLSEILP